MNQVLEEKRQKHQLEIKQQLQEQVIYYNRYPVWLIQKV